MFPLLERYYRSPRVVLPLGAVLPLKGHGTTALLPVSVILLPLSDPFVRVFGLHSFFLVVCVFVCVWFQVMRFLSIRLVVSTPVVPRPSATAPLSPLSLPEDLLVLHLLLNYRRSLGSSQSQAKPCQKCRPRSSGQGAAATRMRTTKIPLWSTVRSRTGSSLPSSLMFSKPRRISMSTCTPSTPTIWRTILNTLVKLFRCALN